MEIFWAVFFGSSAGLFTVNVLTALVEEWRHRLHHKRLEELGQFLEDLEYDDDEEGK